MKILITGGAGFIGSNLANHFIKDHEVYVVDDFSTGDTGFLDEKVTNVFTASIEDRAQMDRIMSMVKPDAVFHMAAQVSLRGSFDDPMNDAQINIIGTMNVFDACIKNGVKHFFYSSSGGAMIDEKGSFPQKENENPQPKSPYGLSKACSEKYISMMKTPEIKTTIFRFSNVYGPNQTPISKCGIVSIFLDDMLLSINPTIYGDGKQTRDFIHVSDIVRAYELALEKESEGVYNLGSGNATSIKEIYDMLAQITGYSNQPTYFHQHSGEVKQNTLYCGKFLNETGWQPQVNIYEGLKQTADWYNKRLTP